MAEANQRKAATLYCAIDASQGFFAHRWRWAIAPGQRAVLLRQCGAGYGVCHQPEAARLPPLAWPPPFALVVCASLYNAMPQAGVDALVDFMAHFQRRYG